MKNLLLDRAPYDTLVNAINNRGVINVSIIGYSHGGGSVYNQSWRMFYDGGTSDTPLYRNPPQEIFNDYNLVFTGYLDAITNSNSANFLGEDRRPLGTDFHSSQYQKVSTILCGCPSDGDDDIDRTYLGVGHTLFSSNEIVLGFLKMRFEQKVDR